MGHVTQAQARSKESSESSLGIQFDRAVPKNGEERPVSFAIQALAAAQTQSDTALENNDELLASGAGQTAGSAGGGGVLRGGSATTAGVLGATGNAVGSIGQTAGAAVGTTTDAATSAAGNASEFNATGHLTSGSRGVIGLQGLQLNSAVESVTQGSVVTSSSQNVHLASGTQMVLRAVSQ